MHFTRQLFINLGACLLLLTAVSAAPIPLGAKEAHGVDGIFIPSRLLNFNLSSLPFPPSTAHEKEIATPPPLGQTTIANSSVSRTTPLDCRPSLKTPREVPAISMGWSNDNSAASNRTSYDYRPDWNDYSGDC